MRLTSLTLRDFRGVRDATVSFAEGVTIIEGPNEVGKSSIPEALRLLREERAGSKKQRIRNVATIGVDAGPEVEVALRTGPYALTYRKRWLRSPVTELHVSEPAVESVTGDQAHERFAEILAATVDVDLWDALQVVQGEALDQPDLARINALHRALDTGAETVDGHDALLTRVEDEYLRLYTPGGKPRGDYARAIDAVAETEQAVREVEERSAELDRLVDAYTRNDERLTALRERARGADDELRAHRGKAKEIAVLRDEVARVEAAEVAAQRAYDDATRRHDERHRLAQSADARVAVVQTAETEVLALASSHEEAKSAEQSARAALVDAERREREARASSAQAARAFSHRREQQVHAALAERVTKAREAERARTTARAECAAAAIDDAAVRNLTERETALRIAEGARDAAAARVAVQVLGAAPVIVDGATISDSYDATVLSPVRVVVDGVVEVEVHPGMQPDDLAHEVDDARTALDPALRDAGVDSVAAAREVAERRRGAVERLADADRTLELVLEGDTVLALEERLEVLARRLAVSADAPAADEGSVAAELPDEDALAEAADRARAAAEAAEARVTELRRSHEHLRGSVVAAGEALARATQARDSAKTEATSEEARLAADRETVSDEALHDAVEHSQAALDAATRAVEHATASLQAADADAVEMVLRNAEDLVQSTAEELTKAQLEEVRLRALIDDRASEGLRDSLDEARALHDAANIDHQRQHRSAQAVKLLRTTLVRHRDEAQRHYATPFKRHIDELGRIVFGQGFDVQISPDLAIASRTLDGTTVPFSSLSGGAREQLAILGRLACAKLVDPAEGAPLILDDTLGFSDPERLRRLAVVLNDVGRTAQVVILTCQPERFAAVGGAQTEQLVRQS